MSRPCFSIFVLLATCALKVRSDTLPTMVREDKNQYAGLAVASDGEISSAKVKGPQSFPGLVPESKDGKDKPATEAERLMKSFKALDTDGTGIIDTKDMHHLMNFWGKHILGPKTEAAKAQQELMGFKGGFKGVPDSIVQEFVNDMDADGDGKVEFKDYAAFATKLQTSASFRQMLQEKRDMAFAQQLTTAIPQLGKVIKEKKAEYMKRNGMKGAAHF